MYTGQNVVGRVSLGGPVSSGVHVSGPGPRPVPYTGPTVAASRQQIRCQLCRACESENRENWPSLQQSSHTPRKRAHSLSTVKRMSASATGRRHATSTIRKITEAQSGRTLSKSHRAAIAAGQRRRHATRRLLVAMEALHQELIVTCEEPASTSATPTEPFANEALSGQLPAQPPVSSSARASQPPAAEGDIAASQPDSPAISTQLGLLQDENLDDVHREYAMRLKEFRTLQAQLRPWREEFEQEHGRRPTIEDAYATEDTSIYELFQEYQRHKDSLMVEIPAMRAALAGSKAAAATAGSKAGKSTGGGYNSNRTVLSPADAAARLQAAREYRGKKAALPAACVGAAAAPGTLAGGEDQAPEASSGQSAAMRVMGLRAKAAGLKGAENPRAKAALLKALEYKQKKQESAVATSASPAGQGNSKLTGTPGSAVRLVSVEGKAIGGIDYSCVDASKAAAGESSIIKAAASPVQSYRRASSILEDGDIGLADTVNALEADTSSVASTIAAATGAAALAAGSKSSSRCSTAKAASSVESLEALLSSGSSAGATANDSVTATKAACDGCDGNGAGNALEEAVWPAALPESQPQTPEQMSGSPPSQEQGPGPASSPGMLKAEASAPCDTVAQPTGSGRQEPPPPTVPVPAAAPAAAAPAMQNCSTSAATLMLELRGKQAAATAAVEAAAAAAVAAVAARSRVARHNFDGLDGVGQEEEGTGGMGLIEATCAAARNAREVHAEFESVRQTVMQGLQDGADTYCGGLLFLSRLL